ncbi:MAG: HAMP domain-containing sensor histidine kinase [bacterium]|nr:HAMP domain-containing sensor histidine kinase [bacterium]
MKNSPISYTFKKILLLFLHFFFVALVFTNIGILYHNEHYGQGLSWLRTEKYEDTAAFSDQFKDDALKVFQYAQCREAFETNGKIDFSKIVAEIYYGPDDERSYTLNEFILYAKARGYYLDVNWNLAFEPTSLSGTDKEKFLVDWKAYDPKYNTDNLDANETISAEMTMEDLSKEVLSYLGSYYYVYNNFMNSASNFYFKVVYSNDDFEYPILTSNVQQLSLDQLKALGKYLYISSELPNDVTNLTQQIHSLNGLAEQSSPYYQGNYEITLAVDTSYPVKDVYCEEALNYAAIRTQYVHSLYLSAAGLLICLATLLALIALTGRTSSNKDAVIRLHGFDQLMPEIFVFFCVLVTLIALYLYRRIGCKLIHIVVPMEHWFYWEKIGQLLLFYIVGFFAGFSLLRRYKARTLWSGSLLSRCIHTFRVSLEHKRFSTILLFFSLAYLIVSTACILGAFYLYLTFPGRIIRTLAIPLVLLWIGLNVFVFHHFLMTSIQRDKINSAIKQLASGDTTYKVPLKDFSGKEKDMAENLNNISSGLETALQEKVRSERLKADLITNVSHDIKTPLTSIINYVDLIKREHISDPKIQSYLEVLDQKSQRLKTLTEDLVEASKASSGNVKLDLMDIDLVELVQQSAGEFEEKFATRNLSLVMGLPEHGVTIVADGRRMWRILENLYNNAFKYAMEQSRIYVDVFTKESSVYFTIKNISATPLNIQPDELTERFVRGDVSRSTEGSGLGLSIAKSLTELQNGQFTIYIDGDLFKAELCFPIKESAR